MPAQLEVLLDKMKVLETELIEELQKQQEEFSYEICKRGVNFEKKRHSQAQGLCWMNIELPNRCTDKTYTQHTFISGNVFFSDIANKCGRQSLSIDIFSYYGIPK